MTALRGDALLSLRYTNIECEGTLPHPLLKKFRKRFFKESVTHSKKWSSGKSSKDTICIGYVRFVLTKIHYSV